MIISVPVVRQFTTAALYAAMIGLMTCLISVPINALAQDVKPITEDRAERLNTIRTVLEQKSNSRDRLRETLSTAAKDEIPELEITLAEINAEIRDLRDSFEQVAVGTANLDIFTERAESVDWRAELTQIMMPIVENLKTLTEKPRKIESLKTQIVVAQERIDESIVAINSIDSHIKKNPDESSRQLLQTLLVDWKDRKANLENLIDRSTIQLEKLQNNDEPMWQTVQEAVVGFIKGRGLTLIIALLVGLLVWYLMKSIANVLLKRSQGEEVQQYRTRQRLVHYGFRLITGLLVLIAVVTTFYHRGDFLLLALSIFLVAAVALGLRHTLPKFIAETRLLLNMGAIREDERVLYNGLPYKVVSLNISSVLRNPELTGIIRLPLETMISMISRPAGKELWFPTSTGDYVLLEDGRLLKVVNQTTELVEFESLSGTKTTIPSADFYHASFENLTRGNQFALSSVFGIGYKHQDIGNTEIPKQLGEAVTDALANTEFSEKILKVSVELKEAAESSLNYWVGVTAESSAAPYYFKIHRVIQQTCVDVCSQYNWDIPFPQLTLHRN